MIFNKKGNQPSLTIVIKKGGEFEFLPLEEA